MLIIWVPFVEGASEPTLMCDVVMSPVVLCYVFVTLLPADVSPGPVLDKSGGQSVRSVVGEKSQSCLSGL